MSQLDSIKNILMTRDEMSEDDADAMIAYCKQLVIEGEDPEEVLSDELGLEPDYIFEIM